MHSYVMYPFVYFLFAFALPCHPLELDRAAACLMLANDFAQHHRTQLTRKLHIIECENVEFILTEPNQTSLLIMALMQIACEHEKERRRKKISTELTHMNVMIS